MELITTLGIDWKLLVAQLINFGVLVVVLTYFIYRPILRLLDQRRDRVRASMEDVKKIEHQRREMEQFKAEQMKRMDLEMSKFLDQAKGQAETVKKEIMAKAQEEADQILVKARKQLEDERGKLVSEVQEGLARTVVRVAERVLEREFSREDQKRMLESVEKNLPSLLK